MPAERLEHLGLEVAAQIWIGPGGHFVHYYVQQRRLVNFVAVVERESWTRESWTDRGEVADALAAYEGWHPQVHAILARWTRRFIWALFDRAPLPRWSSGRVTLLGDACHPMLPFMAPGRGAGDRGRRDAHGLPHARGATTSRALCPLRAAAAPADSRIQALSTLNKTRFHLPDGPEQRARDEAMASGGTDFSIRAVEWIYGHDAAAIQAAA